METTYKQAKEQLKRIATNAKKVHANDKPMIRQIINDTCDHLCKEHRFTEYQRNLLANYCCQLHPED